MLRLITVLLVLLHGSCWRCEWNQKKHPNWFLKRIKTQKEVGESYKTIPTTQMEMLQWKLSNRNRNVLIQIALFWVIFQRGKRLEFSETWMVPTLTWGVNSCHADEACLTWAQLTVMRVSTMTEEQQMFRRASQHRAEGGASISSWGTAKHLYGHLGSEIYFILVFHQQRFHFYILLAQFFL